MTARDLEHAQDALAHKGRRFREASTHGCVTAAAAGCAATFSPHLAIAFAVAAVVAAVMALVARHERMERVAQLALNPDAYLIPEVAEYGRRCAAKRERERLAKRIRQLIADRHPAQSLHLVDRVARHEHDLERIASELASAARVRPPAAVACRRLLTHAVESPLYNPRLPAEDLRIALERIRRGIVTS